jgi:hypothetical protein
MKRNSNKATHAAVGKHWSNSGRLQSKTGGEIGRMSTRLDAIMRGIGEEHRKITGLINLKGVEIDALHVKMRQSFKKELGERAHKDMVIATMQLTNHLHHVERELGSSRLVMKRLCGEAKSLSSLIRKKS